MLAHPQGGLDYNYHRLRDVLYEFSTKKREWGQLHPHCKVVQVLDSKRFGWQKDAVAALCPEMRPWYTESLEADLQQVIEAVRALEVLNHPKISGSPDPEAVVKEDEDGCGEDGKREVKRRRRKR